MYDEHYQALDSHPILVSLTVIRIRRFVEVLTWRPSVNRSWYRGARARWPGQLSAARSHQEVLVPKKL